MSYNPFSLEGKTILVTGASSGIGRSIAVECSRMGGRIISCGRNIERLEETLSQLEGDGHITVVGDLSLDEDRRRIVAELPELHGVVYNAGIARRQLCKSVKASEISRILDINFASVVLLQQQIMKKKKLLQGASIVMMASRAAFSPSIGNAVYSASKGALISYSKVLGLELADRKIRVNCICPGMVFTDLVRKEGELLGVDFEEVQKKYPLGRFGTPEDVAYLVVYLLSEASQWMTGSCIDISGGGEMVLV